MIDADATLKALAEPRRREILRLVGERELSAGQVATHFDVSRPAISQHLGVLRQAGLISERREGARRIYATIPGRIEELNEYLTGFWGEGLGALKVAAEAEQTEAEPQCRLSRRTSHRSSAASRSRPSPRSSFPTSPIRPDRQLDGGASDAETRARRHLSGRATGRLYCAGRVRRGRPAAPGGLQLGMGARRTLWSPPERARSRSNWSRLPSGTRVCFATTSSVASRPRSTGRLDPLPRALAGRRRRRSSRSGRGSDRQRGSWPEAVRDPRRTPPAPPTRGAR